MKDIFNIRRFGKYFVSDLGSAAANFGLSLLLLSSAGVIVYLLMGFFSLITSGTWDGSGMAIRCATLAISYVVLMISMPPKCYGHLTDKRSGSTWLMIPASTLEKYLSMVLITILVIPAVFFGVYCGLDAILCAIDPNCGDSFFTILGTIPSLLDEIPEIAVAEFVTDMMRPYSFIDDHIYGILVFLLGAICFKNNKSAKTILCLIGLSMGVSMIVSPVVLHSMVSVAGSLEEISDPSAIFNSPLFNNLKVFDTVSDLVLMTGLLVAVYFRVRTLKH